MDNETIRKLFNLTDDEYKRIVDYQKKAEVATVLYCEDHEREYFDFEKQCDECIREKLEFDYEREEEAKCQ
jgi:hypothetical protein